VDPTTETSHRQSADEEPSGRPIPELEGALLTTAESAYLLGLSKRSLEALRVRGGGPVFVVLGRRAVRYRRSDIVAWVDERRYSSTSDIRAKRPVPQSSFDQTKSHCGGRSSVGRLGVS
jgi:predicted DNA-binding transcriptional regulator AlpA